ncbi:MAG: FtsL-like putative cell division protein [Paludibacter sp.]|nr:FtsL-like putative cell division protein [Paludibacter sp.]
MSWLKKIADAIKGSEDFSDIKSSTVRDILNGNILTKKILQKQYGLIIMIALLTFFYVDNRFYCETQLAKEIELKKKIQDVKYESLTIKAELMKTSRQSNVQRMINERGVELDVTSTPPIVIEEPKKE